MQLPETEKLITSGTSEGLHIGAQLCIWKDGEEYRFSHGEAKPGTPMEDDTLMLWLSASKPIAATAIMQLWERERLALDDLVSTHIPEFSGEGKQSITIRHLLTHTAGIRTADIASLETSIESALSKVYSARKEPDWTPGQKGGYHTGGSWLLLGEIIRRLDGRPYQTYAREEILLPLGMSHSWIGLPEDHSTAYGDRIAIMHTTEKSTPKPHPHWEREGERLLPKPGSHGCGPIHELNRFYRALLQHGQLHSHRILEPQTVEAMTARHRVGILDRTFRTKMDFGLGIMLQSTHYGETDIPYGFGKYASHRTYGHGGAQSSLAFADPEHNLAISFVFNGMPGEASHQSRSRALTESIYQELSLT